MGEVTEPPLLLTWSGGTLGVLEVLDRDGQVRQTHAIERWPLMLGRAVDNHVVLPDPHVARHHLRIEPGEFGLVLHAGQTLNGVLVDNRRLRGGMSQTLADSGEPPELTLGRTRVRLRLRSHTLPPELPLPMSHEGGLRRLAVPVLGTLGLLAALSLDTWLDSDRDTFLRAWGGLLLASALAAAAWCGLWALLSKVFTHQARFGWHWRVLVLASLAWLGVELVAATLAFAGSWPVLTDFAFIGTYAVGAVALYGHLLAVEPARERLLRGVAAVALVTAVSLQLWFNQQRADRFGSELYMSHLFPPLLRRAEPAALDQFVDGLVTLQRAVDRKALEPPFSDGSSDGDGDDGE